MYLNNNFATNHLTVIFLSLIFLSGCGGGSGGGSSAPEITQVIANSQTPIYWNLDAAFSYGMDDGKYTQQITVIENGDVLRTAFRDIGTQEVARLEASFQSSQVPNFQGVRENSQLTSWSTGKSFMSIVMGIAQDQSFLDIDEYASQYLTEWSDDERNQITIRHLLNMRSGLQKPTGEAGGNITVYANQLQMCLALELQEEINAKFEYNNCSSMLLGEIIERATGQDFKTYADINLFNPLEINASWWTDLSGNYLSYCCVDMTQAEYAKFGMMLLNKGNGIVSESYIDDILTTTANYNLQFWFFDSTMQTIGFDGQFIVVDFNNDLLILRNSLYHPQTDGDYVLNNTGDSNRTGPITLPDALLGDGNNFSMSEFLRILKTP